MKKIRNKTRGFTLIEVLIGSVIFLMVAIAAFNTYSSLFKLAKVGQARTLAIQLAHEQFEVIRNIPYASIGIVGGVPSGVIAGTQTLTRGGMVFNVYTAVRNIDMPFDGLMGSTTDPDTTPADNKLVEIQVACASCQGFSPVIITGQIAPKGLETTNPNNGSMLLNVFDSRGKPVQGAVLHIVDTATTTSVVVDDVTNASGTLEVIDIPSGVNAYSVAVTKPGYSSDKNYPVGSSSNPNPLAPYSTVAAGQITQASFSIDLLGSTNMLSVATSCNPIPNFHFSMIGAKLIGTNLPKYSKNLSTDSNGALNLNSMEWDSYTIVPNDSSYDLLGLNPLNPVTLAAGSSTGISLVAVTKSPKSLLITVEDNGSHQVVGGATVELDGPSSYTKTLLDMTGSTNCFPPGEFLFQSLNAGTYTVHVSKSGYTSTSASITVSNDWMESVVLLPKDH